jgi:hypothetical protein
MKLEKIQHLDDYLFLLTFETGEVVRANLKMLIGDYVDQSQLASARVDSDWGCLEFNHGQVDIDPKTLYQFVMTQKYQQAA